ncbi:esterase LipC [Mycobacterium tuberculosis TKK-01-0003]|nr:esterase LipC [Mycobacterium tuberculosis TKK_03_0039]KBY08582.1 esterase LipC [Mycobacterium tuberculosis TKK-01-0003]KCA68521.1 esterase LipC [Mycobacterium tuberculosis TKK-01-0082]
MNQRRAAGSTGVAYIRWLLRARPADYMLALSVAGGSLPVVGKHLKPLGGVTAIGVWGARHASDFLSATAKDLLTPGINEVRRRDRASTQEVSVAALRGIVSPDDLAVEWPAPERTPPVCGALRHRRYVHRRRVLYGDDPAQLLDVWRRKDMPTKPAPVLIFVPGGAWVHGSRAIQGYAVLSRLGVPIDRLPGRTASPLATTHPGCQDRHRVGTGQCRQIRR